MVSKKTLISIFLIFIINLFSINLGNAAINLAISPIKYKLEGTAGSVITKTAKIRNPSNDTIHIITGKSDFVPNGDNGIPKFIRKSEMVYPDQQLSEWITIDTDSFDIAPGETKIISYSIHIPDNATPGGHYGAIFFKNNNSESSSGVNVGINIDYGVLILLEVEGDIIIDARINDPIIQTGGGGNQLVKDNCPNGDNSKSYYDGTCEATEEDNTGTTDNNTGTVNDENNENNLTIEDSNENNENDLTTENSNENNENDLTTENSNENNENTTIDENNKKDEDFNIGFVIPIDNKGNTHIKPKGKITLKDENGNIIRKVGKEIVVNDKGVNIGEKIVDYIPINDVGGVVIPGYSRDFKCSWKGFPYKDYDDEGNQIINYWSPNEYYTRKNLGESKIIMPWEKVGERKVNKIITAEFNIKYRGLDGKDTEYNSAKEFPVEYTEKYITINYYILYPILAILFLIFLLIIIAISNRTKCIKCKKSIKKDMKVCPYCGTKQKKKK